VGCAHAAEALSIRPAASRDELEQAFHLVYQSFLQRGYIEKSPAELRLSIFNAFPETVTFVGDLRGKVVATVTLVPDTPVGLPMDEIFHDEVQALRDQGRKITEVTMLADRRHELRRALPVVLVLMKRLFDYATLMLKASDLCITVNPRHESYYRRFLLFEQIGSVRDYPSVRNNPALAARLDLENVREACRGNERLLRHFFTDRTPLSLLRERYVMTPADLHYFFVRRTPIFRQAAQEQIGCLRQFYPECPWDEWLG